jgi:RimJ/RimL family protein N-acetyltransferase
MDLHHWPLYGLRLTTSRLELRLPDLPLLDRLAAIGAEGVHEPDAMPFSVAWTDGTPQEVGRGVFQHVLSTVAGWQPDNWTMSFAVLAEGELVGRQDLMARRFAVTGEVETGSWLGLRHQGRGIGTEMRAAALELAFAGLGARAATSAAMLDNPRSLGVSRRLGYRPDGLETQVVRDRAVTLQRLRLSREDWAVHRTVRTRIHGLEPCRELFGAAGPRTEPAEPAEPAEG